jgi:hypothetical protein
LQEAKELEEEDAEVGVVAQRDSLTPSIKGLPERDAGDQQQAQVQTADEVVP